MAIKRVLLSEVKTGMELANDLYDEQGRLILPIGTKFDRENILKLKNYDIVSIKIFERSELEDLFNSNHAKSKRSELNYYEKIKNTKQFEAFDEQFTQSVDILENQLNQIVIRNKEINVYKMLQSVKAIINSNKTGYSMLDMLNCIRGYDDLTYAHSMNVALICNVMAKWLKFNDEETDQLLLAGLLHDIGKIKIPKQILSKPGKLTDKEYQIIQYHTILGYDIIKNYPIDAVVKNAALMHHERYNGTGYPHNLKGDSIDKISRIVAIADVYDAMTADRVYREGLSPFDVIDYFESCMELFDPELCLIFLEHTAQSYVSCTVLLSDGREAKIALINKTALGKPVVMIDNDPLDLSKNRDIKIVRLL